MLCENCGQKEANIDVTVVCWPPVQTVKHLCQSCGSKVGTADVQVAAVQPGDPLHVEPNSGPLSLLPGARPEDAARLYCEYDQRFRAFLARATQVVGAETIQVERLSEQFTVPQKLSVKGSPYEVGLTIGHIGKQARFCPTTVRSTNRALNEKVVAVYQKIYPAYLELVRG